MPLSGEMHHLTRGEIQAFVNGKVAYYGQSLSLRNCMQVKNKREGPPDRCAASREVSAANSLKHLQAICKAQNAKLHILTARHTHDMLKHSQVRSRWPLQP